MAVVELKASEKKLYPEVVEAPRYSCALGGAYMAALASFGAVPILHSGGGCGFAQNFGQHFAAGLNNGGMHGGANTPCSTLVEEHVVFGGEDKLRKLIASTIKLMPGELYSVISACVPALIGDDVDAVVKEFKEQVPIFHVKTAGFVGNSYTGYELYFDALIDQILEPVPKEEKTVNLLGIVPVQHIFWKGDLQQIKLLLKKIGIKANIIFTELKGLEAIKQIPAAELNLVFSPWGVKPANKLNEKFGTPFEVVPSVPIGPKDTSRFLRAVGQRLNVNPAIVEAVVAEEETKAYRFAEYMGNVLVIALPHAYTGIVADSNYAVGVTRYAANELGFIPQVVIITDNPPEEYRAEIIRQVTEKIEGALKPDVYFEVDSHKIRQILKKYTLQLLLSSSLERYIAQDELNNAIFLSVAFPTYDRLIIHRSYVGFQGGLDFMEDLMANYGGPL